MSFSRMGTPRIFVSNVDYLMNCGKKYWTGILWDYGASSDASGFILQEEQTPLSKSVWGINPGNQQVFVTSENANRLIFSFMVDGVEGGDPPWIQESVNVTPTELNHFISTTNCVITYGHTCKSLGCEIIIKRFGRNNDGLAYTFVDPETDDVTGDHVNTKGQLADGYTINYFKDFDEWVQVAPEYYYGYSLWLESTSVFPSMTEIPMGSIIPATFFDFSNSPDLGVTQSFTYDGIETTQTRGGSTFTNIINKGCPPMGLNQAPFQNEDPGDLNNLRVKEMFYSTQKGKKKWDISFSYMSDEKIFPKNSYGHVSGDYEDGDPSHPNDFYFNSSSSDSSNFVGTVLSKTFGGNLKFIWQPNKNVDEYYFCKIVSGSINFEQITHKTYNVSFSLEEAW